MDEENKNYIFEVAAGTYEEFLLCYKFIKEEEGYQLIHSVASHSHKASLRSIASSKKLLVTGGADEAIHIYDLCERRQQGMLSHHSGTVTCLEFSPDGSYLMSSGEDGSLALISVGSWKVQHSWDKAHKGQGVTGFSIHPSGKVALSVGKDKMIRTWNLVTGRRAFTVSLGKRCGNLEMVRWSTEGNFYVVPYQCKVDIYTTSSAAVLYEIKVPTKVLCVNFLSDDTLVVGEQSGCVSAHQCSTGEEIWRIKVGEERVRALSTFGSYLVTAGSQGTLSVYDTLQEPIVCLASVDSKCRITCLTLSSPSSDLDDGRMKKRKRKEQMKEETDPKSTTTTFDNTTEKSKLSDSIIYSSTKKSKLDVNVQCSPSNQKWKVQNIC